MPSHRIRLLVLTLIVCGALAYLGIERYRRAPIRIDETQLLPVGRWHRLGSSIASDEDLARTLSLPYLAGSMPVSGRAGGVLELDRERVSPGVNLYVSGHAPEAILMDMEGRVLHRWQCPFERALPDRRPSIETGFFRRAHLLPDGDLIALYQGGGLVRLNRDSEIVWSAGLGTFNDLFVDADGRIVVLTKRARRLPSLRRSSPVLEDSVTILDGSGRVVRSISLLSALLEADLGYLLDATGNDSADILHSNTVTVLDPQATNHPGFEPGNILVSLREIDLLAVLDPATGRFTWTLHGAWRRQHEPSVLDDGRLLLFDNLGSDTNSRVLELDAGGGGIGWEYGGPAHRPLRSPEAGSCARLANGNTLISDSEQGRALEITADGSIVWEFESPHRAGTRGEFVATLFELIRIPRDEVAWLDDLQPPR
jgi:hypothetical protein